MNKSSDAYYLSAVGHGEDPYKVVAEAIQEGTLPKGARLGPRRQTPQGWYKKPENAVGSIKVGYKTLFWVVK